MNTDGRVGLKRGERKGRHMNSYERAVEYWHQQKICDEVQLAETIGGRSIYFAYNSGKIENDSITYYDTREIFEHDGVSSYTGDLRTLYEIRNSKVANDYFFYAYKNKLPLDGVFIRELQKRLTMNTYDSRRWRLGERPGEYRKHDDFTGSDSGGAAPESIEAEMAGLLDELKDIDRHNVLTAAAYFLLKFESIHPFSDGNGRTARLAMDYFLVLNDHPPLIICEEDRKEFYAAIEAWSKAQQLEPMVIFLKAQTAKTWERQFDRSRSTASLESFLK